MICSEQSRKVRTEEIIPLTKVPKECTWDLRRRILKNKFNKRSSVKATKYC